VKPRWFPGELGSELTLGRKEKKWDWDKEPFKNRVWLFLAKSRKARGKKLPEILQRHKRAQAGVQRNQKEGQTPQRPPPCRKGNDSQGQREKNEGDHQTSDIKAMTELPREAFSYEGKKETKAEQEKILGRHCKRKIRRDEGK